MYSVTATHIRPWPFIGASFPATRVSIRAELAVEERVCFTRRHGREQHAPDHLSMHAHAADVLLRCMHMASQLLKKHGAAARVRPVHIPLRQAWHCDHVRTMSCQRPSCTVGTQLSNARLEGVVATCRPLHRTPD